MTYYIFLEPWRSKDNKTMQEISDRDGFWKTLPEPFSNTLRPPLADLTLAQWLEHLPDSCEFENHNSNTKVLRLSWQEVVKVLVSEHSSWNVPAWQCLCSGMEITCTLTALTCEHARCARTKFCLQNLSSLLACAAKNWLIADAITWFAATFKILKSVKF